MKTIFEIVLWYYYNSDKDNDNNDNNNYLYELEVDCLCDGVFEEVDEIIFSEVEVRVGVDKIVSTVDDFLDQL